MDSVPTKRFPRLEIDDTQIAHVSNPQYDNLKTDAFQEWLEQNQEYLEIEPKKKATAHKVVRTPDIIVIREGSDPAG